MQNREGFDVECAGEEIEGFDAGELVFELSAQGAYVPGQGGWVTADVKDGAWAYIA